jgi:hypothetical protein
VGLDADKLNLYLGPGNLMVQLTIRGLRSSPSTFDNDIAVPIYYTGTSTSFLIYLEETSPVG